MKIFDVPLAVLRLQYQVARFPLHVIEEQVVARARTEAPARLFYERSLGMLDTTVGTALRDDKLVEQGVAMVERSEALTRAAQLDANATATVKQSGRKVNKAENEAIQQRQEARAATKDEVKEAREAAQKRKREAVKSVHDKADLAKRHADEVAAGRKQAADSNKRRAETKADAAQQAATKAATAKLSEAQAMREQAADKRAEAERVEDLAAAEKNDRKANDS
jgi:hypothetical protein